MMFSKNENVKENKIDKDTAENDFLQFCDDWDIDTDKTSMSQDEQDQFDNLKRPIIRKIMSGNLVYKHTDECFDYQMLKPIKDSHGGYMPLKKITISRGTAESYWVMDKYKDGENMKKAHSKIARMIDLPIQTVSGIDEVDLKVLNAVLTLFLAS